MKVKVLIKKAKLASLNLMKKRKSLKYHKAINPNQKWKKAKEKKHKTLKTNRVQSLRMKMNSQSKKKKNMIRKKMNLIHLKTKGMKEGKMLRIIRS